MLKKLDQETPEELGARYRREVQELVDSGELSAAEAQRILDEVLRRRPSLRPPRHSD